MDFIGERELTTGLYIGQPEVAAYDARLIYVSGMAKATKRGNTRNPSDPELGRRIVALMARNKVLNNGGAASKAQLATATGVSPSAAGGWANKGTVARQQIVPVCKALKCSADELLGMKPIGEVEAREYALDEIAEALEFVAKFEKMEKRTLSPREKAQVLLNVIHL
jgi:hypothetical protein